MSTSPQPKPRYGAAEQAAASPFHDDRPTHMDYVTPVRGARIILVRHGQTTGNISRRLDTALPGAPLTDAGVTQARRLGRMLAPDAERITEIVTSHALRARQTGAGAVAGLHHQGQTRVRLRHEAGLHEIQAGVYEGRNDAAAHAAYMCAFYQWLDGDIDYRLPGGESGAEVLQRYLPALTTLIERSDSDNHDLIVVSHGAAIRVAAQYLTGVSPDYALHHRIPNTERIELVPLSGAEPTIAPGAWQVRRWGDSPLPQDAA